MALWYGWRTVRSKKERELRESVLYKDAVNEWEHIQAWYVRERRRGLLPYLIVLDAGAFCEKDVLAKEDSDGKVFLPAGLAPSEFILAVRELSIYFSDMSGYRCVKVSGTRE